jgi:hypothetical protein
VPLDLFHAGPRVGLVVSWGALLYLHVLKPYGPAFYHGFFKPLVWDPFKLVVQYLADALKPYVGPVAIAAFVGYLIADARPYVGSTIVMALLLKLNGGPVILLDIIKYFFSKFF